MRSQNMSSLLAAYRKSMKPRGMDGPIDLYLYRPIGFGIAWVLSYTRTSPNAVTAGSALLGLAAGLCALRGTSEAFLLCALLFQAANFLDCADGQLARLSGRQSPEGRIIDGFADYLVNIFIYVGVLLGLLHGGHSRLPALLLVAAGGLATAFSNMHYDRALTRLADLLHPSEKATDEAQNARAEAARSTGLRRLFWRGYAVYARLIADRGAQVSGGADAAIPRLDAAEAMLPLLDAWSFTGPSAHVLYFLVFAAIGKMEWYFVGCLALAQATLVLLGAQRLVELRRYGRPARDNRWS